MGTNQMMGVDLGMNCAFLILALPMSAPIVSLTSILTL